MQTGRVLITGSGSGLGRALALHYARNGWRVAIADLLRERAESVAAEIRASGGKADAYAADITDDASMQALRRAIETDFGGLEHLVNNAGVSSAGDTLDTPLDDWRWMLDVNLLGVVRGCQVFAPLLAQDKGHIINIASFAALAGAPGLASYSVAKAGVVALSESLRAEFALRGSPIGVSVVCPSFFQTNLLQNYRGPEKMKRTAGKLMEKSHDTAESVAAAIYAGAAAKRFLILPTQAEPLRWCLKRWFPEFYFRKLIAAVKAEGGRA